jgi:hypothetical protein
MVALLLLQQASRNRRDTDNADIPSIVFWNVLNTYTFFYWNERSHFTRVRSVKEPVILRDIWGFDGGEDSFRGVMGCVTASLVDRLVPTFEGIMLPPSWGKSDLCPAVWHSVVEYMGIRSPYSVYKWLYRGLLHDTRSLGWRQCFAEHTVSLVFCIVRVYAVFHWL